MSDMMMTWCFSSVFTDGILVDKNKQHTTAPCKLPKVTLLSRQMLHLCLSEALSEPGWDACDNLWLSASAETLVSP